MKTTHTINIGYGSTVTKTFTAAEIKAAIFRAFDNGATIAEIKNHWQLTAAEIKKFRAEYRAQ